MLSNYQAILKSPLIVTEGSMFEALRRNQEINLHPTLAHSVLVYEKTGRKALHELYKSYLDSVVPHGLPMILFTATWRASLPRLKNSEYHNKPVNEDNVRFLIELRKSYSHNREKILIGGLIGCIGDAHKPEEGLSVATAEKAHHFQAEKLAKGGVDFLFGSSLPAVKEALGMAQAMARTGLPYVLSFIIRKEGTVLDGTSLSKAIQQIDAETKTPPSFYMVNCIHPSVLEKAIRRDPGFQHQAHRLLGLQANTSSLSPEELEKSVELKTEEPLFFAQALLKVAKRFHLKVLGGCCGTDKTHIEAIAKLALTSQNVPGTFWYAGE